MPNYHYKAKKGPGEVVEGELQAEDEEAAIHKVSSMGLIPIKIEPAKSILSSTFVKQVKQPAIKPAAKTPSKKPKEVSHAKTDNQLKKVRVPYKVLNIFTRQFSILLKANVPLLKAFDILQVQTENEKFKQILARIKEEIKEGEGLSEVLETYPRIFSQVYVSMIRSGEVSGTLDKVLIRLADFAEKEADLRSKVQSAMIYPLFLGLAGVATIFVLLTFVMPRLMVVFGDLGTELPEITQAVIAVSEFCQHYWIGMLGAAAGLFVFFRSKGLTEGQWKAIDGVMITLPVFGTLTKKAELSKFLRSIELLYENGIPLYQAVMVGLKTITNRVMKKEFLKIPPLLEGGSTLAASLIEVDYVSEFVTNMVAVGEESGQLGSAVGETASFYEQETEQFIKVATSLIEPFMILTIGIAVGFIVIAMLLPIFEIHVTAS